MKEGKKETGGKARRKRRRKSGASRDTGKVLGVLLCL
jgi:hypothetical protein